MATKMKKSKFKTGIVLGILLLFSIIFSPLLSQSTVKAEGNAEEKPYLLSFEIFRPCFSDIESNLIAIYSNHWMRQSTNAIFDRDAWRLNSFEMEYELHIEDSNGERSAVSEKMFFLPHLMIGKKNFLLTKSLFPTIK